MRWVRVLAVVAVLVAALATASGAHAWPTRPSGLPLARGCVPQQELSWSLRVAARRVLGRRICVPPLRVRVSHYATVPWAYRRGQIWCTLTNARPGAPLGTVLSLASAARFCRRYGRGWAYVRVRLG